MKLAVDALEQLFQLSLVYLEQSGVQEVRFENEGYYPKFWRKDIKFDDFEYMKCPEFVLGDLDDDIDDLKSVLKDRHGFFGLYMQKLGIILETLGALLDEGTYFQAPGKRRCPKLSLKQLKRLFEMTVSFVDETGLATFENSDDRYLKIPHKKVNLYDDMFWKCPPYVISLLTEDISDLKKVLACEVKMDDVYLQKLGAVLTAMGETI